MKEISHEIKLKLRLVNKKTLSEMNDVFVQVDFCQILGILWLDWGQYLFKHASKVELDAISITLQNVHGGIRQF